MVFIYLPTRLSSPQQSFQILQEVSQKIHSYPFNYRGASVLSGQEEGAYGWVTVNYLSENFIKVSAVTHSAMCKLYIHFILILAPLND